MSAYMMSESEVISLTTDLVAARMANDRPWLVQQLRVLMTGDRMNAANVASAVAKLHGKHAPPLPPGRTFHRFEVEEVHRVTGERRWAAPERLPGHQVCFGRMVIALLNGDPDMAHDLFLGYCADDATKAFHVISYGLYQFVHAETGGCANCGGEERA